MKKNLSLTLGIFGTDVNLHATLSEGKLGNFEVNVSHDTEDAAKELDVSFRMEDEKPDLEPGSFEEPAGLRKIKDAPQG